MTIHTEEDVSVAANDDELVNGTSSLISSVFNVTLLERTMRRKYTRVELTLS